MPRKNHRSPSSTTKSSSSKSTRQSRESTPGMATTPATSVHSSTPRRNGIKHSEKEEISSQPVVTEEMVKEESDLHEKDLADSASQVCTSSIHAEVDEY